MSWNLDRVCEKVTYNLLRSVRNMEPSYLLVDGALDVGYATRTLGLWVDCAIERRMKVFRFKKQVKKG